MPRMLDVSEDVRAEIGDEEADRLLAGENAPGSYDCTSCRTPGDSEQERTSTVLFVGEETAVLAFAHATCIPSQVVRVSEEQLQGAVRSITGDAQPPAPAGAPAPAQFPDGAEQAVLGVTSGLVLLDGELHPALVVEPTAPIARPGSAGTGDEFLPLLIEQGFVPVSDVNQKPAGLAGWSVLLAMGQLHAILQPGSAGGSPVAWWQAHQPLQVTEGWRAAANKSHTVLVFAAPVGSIGQQPREDLLRDALEKAAANGRLVAAAMPLAGTS
ncbi:hypothetical protein BJP40_14810 [Streptomyces sp. CC53]|uniref:hypothetical protein n=1 Tax=unclassified Streptomyces TaxID=2593676 RepID=UPI0008DDA3B6|nr:MULTISPECIES: hypothetical protein [unclassified Streptomyces]OII61877.1 hypothetical protein BJP39_10555 [Streptomyces sp. CC77]OII66044.1 hypothetical protein BJP40_14810 [Streptomyces sp. CC53]